MIFIGGGTILSKLDRYILKELWAPLIVGTLTILLMFLANLLIVDFPKLQQYNPSLVLILKYAAYKTPGFLELSLPIGIAIGTSLSTSRLVRESEFVILKASGVPIIRYVFPILCVGSVVGFLNFNVMEHLVPKTEKAAKELRNKITSDYTGENIRTDILIKLGKYTAYIGYIERAKNDEVKVAQVFLKETHSDNKIVLIAADQGTYHQKYWRLFHATSYTFENDILTTSQQLKEFKFYEPFKISSIFESTHYGPKNTQEITTKILSDAIEEGNKRQLNTLNLEVAYYNKYAIPTACIIFALTGPVLAAGLASGGPFIGVLISILLVMAYYNVFVVFTEIVGSSGWLPAVFCSWLPNLFFLTLGVILIRKNR